MAILEETSDTLPVLFGVPQGSCLCPLLFLIYINDLYKISQSSEIVLFADDTNIFISAKTKEIAFSNTQSLLDLISKYMNCNKLHINLDKTCYMYFNSNKKHTSTEDIDGLNLEIEGTPIPQVDHTKFLGIIIDEDLTWEKHIKSLAKKLSCCTGRLNRIIQFLPKNLHKDLYHTLFESYLSYGISVWGGVSHTKLKPVLKAQKKAIRVMFGDREQYLDKFKTCVRTRPYPEQKLTSEFFIKERTKPIFNDKNLLILENLYFFHSCSEIFKIFK